MSVSTDDCVAAYHELRNLKLVGERLGVKWQTVYAKLRKAGIEVTGDKARYGSVSDRLAVNAEMRFQKAVPLAVDNNQLKYQATVDFYFGPHTIDVKASRLNSRKHSQTGKATSSAWSFCISKQKDVADFFVLYLYGDGDDVSHVALIPREIATTKTSILIPETLRSKWADYFVDESDLGDFFSYL